MADKEETESSNLSLKTSRPLSYEDFQSSLSEFRADIMAGVNNYLSSFRQEFEVEEFDESDEHALPQDEPHDGLSIGDKTSNTKLAAISRATSSNSILNSLCA